MIYDCLIIGGGIAGLQCAIQLGRYMHKVLVIDAGDGRSTWCREYHNILGYPSGVSGLELREKGYYQAKKYGVEFVLDLVQTVEKQDKHFVVTTKDERKYVAKRLLFATGVTDRLPDIPELYRCLGSSIYICPDCDGYEIKDQSCLVLGAGNVGANAALTLQYWSKEIIFVNHESEQKQVDEALMTQLEASGIGYYASPIVKVLLSGEGQFAGVVLKNGIELEAKHGFAAFGNNEVKSELAAQLGVERLENKHIIVDARSKMTSVANVWAAGDVVAHSEQVTVALGDGIQAAISIHKTLVNES